MAKPSEGRLYELLEDARGAARYSGERSAFVQSEAAEGIGYVANLSRTGLHVRSPLEVRIGEGIHLTIASVEGDLVEAWGVVSRLADEGFGVALTHTGDGYQRLAQECARA